MWLRNAVVTAACAALSLSLPGNSLAWQQSGFLIGGFGIGSATDSTRYTRLYNAGLDFVVNNDQWGTWSAQQFVTQIASLHSQYQQAFKLNGIVMEKTYPESTKTMYACYAESTVASRLSDLYFNQYPGDAAVSAAVAAKLAPSQGLNGLETMGWFNWDEPIASCHMDRAFLIDTAVQDSPDGTGKLPYINLDPPYIFSAGGLAQTTYRSTYGSDSLTAYRNYLTAWLARFDQRSSPAPVLSFDHYPYWNPSSEKKDFLFALRTARDRAALYSRPTQRVPLWLSIQLSPDILNFNGSTPTVAQTTYQAYAALAYGAKAILYWTVVPENGQWGDGILTSTGAQSTKYTAVRQLNADLHKIGSVLFDCDPVWTYQSDLKGQVGVSDELIGAAECPYNAVTSIELSPFLLPDHDGIVGHLKSRSSGADYLLVVNRSATTSRTFVIGLGSAADTVYKLDKASGGWTSVGTNATSFTTPSIAAGTGELYRLVDKTFEYIPNGNCVLVDGPRVFYGHQRGVVLVNYATGYRRAWHDGTVYTPVRDLALLGDTLYIAQGTTAGGNIFMVDRLLNNVGTRLCDAVGAPPGACNYVTGITPAVDRLIAVERLSATKGRIISLGRAGGEIGRRDIAFGANDVCVDLPSSNIIVGHSSGMNRHSLSSLDSLGYWQNGTVTTPVVKVVSAPNAVLAALDDGTGGALAKVDPTNLGGLGWWTDGGLNSRVLDVAVAPISGECVAISSKSSTKASRIRLSDMTALSSQAITSPRGVGLGGGDTTYICTAAGIERRSRTSLGTFASYPSTDRESKRSSGLLGVRVSIRGGSTAFELSADVAGEVSIEVFDVAGRRLWKAHRAVLPTEHSTVVWESDRIGSGVYFYRAAMGGRRLTGKVVLTR